MKFFIVVLVTYPALHILSDNTGNNIPILIALSLIIAHLTVKD